MRVAALIPARSGSRRVVDKNLCELGKSSLIARKIQQLKLSQVDEIFLGSDSDLYLEIGEKNGATAIKRSDLACDESLRDHKPCR